MRKVILMGLMLVSVMGVGALKAYQPMPMPVYTATVDGWTINLYLVNGLYQGNELVNGDTLHVSYNPWWNARLLMLPNEADELRDELSVRRSTRFGQDSWKYEGPANFTSTVYTMRSLRPGGKAMDCTIVRLP